MEILDQRTIVLGLRVHYLQAGVAGSPVILLHGAGTDSARLSWEQAIGPLAQNHRVYAPDLPGYGESDRPDIDYTSDFYVGFLGGLMDVLGVARASLVGLSMGGAIALGSVLRWPERVDRLVLVDAYGLQRTVALHKLSYLMVHTPGLLEATWFLVQHSRAAARASLGNVFHDVKAVPDELLDQVVTEARTPHAGRAFTAYQRHDVSWHGLRTGYLDRLNQIHVPTLIIHGREDRAVPLACAEAAHRLIAGSQLQVIDGAGHWPQREKPEAFNRVLTEFLAEPPRAEVVNHA